MGGSVRIGVSGWRYPPWRGTFYPAGLPQGEELAYASRQLDTIELNGSFYSLQTPASYRRWFQATPAHFVFSIKGGRYITHLRRLRDVKQPLGNFFASGMAELGDKLGPFLWQFPPNFAFVPDRVEAFLALLPRDTAAASRLARAHDDKLRVRARITYGANRPLRHAMEVRHPSFIHPDFIALLRKYGVAFVVADTAGKWVEFDDVTADFVYLRLHGATALYQSRYTEAELDRFAARITRWSEGREPEDARRISTEPPPERSARDVFCYFDNTDKIHAPWNAMCLADKLGSRAAPAPCSAPRPRA